jgi:hypothetical protein
VGRLSPRSRGDAARTASACAGPRPDAPAPEATMSIRLDAPRADLRPAAAPDTPADAGPAVARAHADAARGGRVRPRRPRAERVAAPALARRPVGGRGHRSLHAPRRRVGRARRVLHPRGPAGGGARRGGRRRGAPVRPPRVPPPRVPPARGRSPGG